MTANIRISDFGNTIISIATAKQIAVHAIDLLKLNEKIVMDFSGIYSMTTQCANAIISDIYNYIGDDLKKRVIFTAVGNNIQYIISDALRYILNRENNTSL